MISPKTAMVVLRSSKLFLLAVIVGVANTAAGLGISLVSVALLVRRIRPALEARRLRLERQAFVQAKQSEWDARWEAWGGRV